MQAIFMFSVFLWLSDRSFHFQTIFVMDLTLNDKSELVLLTVCSRSFSATCNEFKRLDPEKKDICTVHREATENEVSGVGFFSP